MPYRPEDGRIVIMSDPPDPFDVEGWRRWTERARALGAQRLVRKGERIVADLEERAAQKAAARPKSPAAE